MRHLSLAILWAGTYGCALAPPAEVGKMRTSKSFSETVALLTEMTRKCWLAKVDPVTDGIVVETRGSQEGGQFVISGHRLNWGVGLVQQPFIVVAITAANNETIVTVEEGDFRRAFFGLHGSYRLDAAAHIPPWLEGDLQCKRFRNTLTNLV